MKRKIKFRAWDNKDKRMIVHEQDFVPLKITNHGVFKLSPLHHDNLYFIIDDKDRFELMQFTGLTDKNGKDIYDGDILSEMWKAEVFRNSDGTFMVEFHTNPTYNKPMVLSKYLKSRIKALTEKIDNVIIGNIYENPELIK